MAGPDEDEVQYGKQYSTWRRMLLFSWRDGFAADIKKPGARGTGTGKARHSPEKPVDRRHSPGLAIAPEEERLQVQEPIGM